MFTFLPFLLLPPPPLHAVVRSLVLLLHGFGTSTLSRSPPCARGTVLYSGDPALVAGDCIATSMGSRHLGWVPWVSWKPTLVVGGGGEMIATRPDGTRVRQTLKQAIIIDIVVFTTILNRLQQATPRNQSTTQAIICTWLFILFPRCVVLKYKIISQYHPESERAWFATCDCSYYITTIPNKAM